MVWFRNDLRLEANPAFSDATAAHDEVACVVNLDQRLLKGAGPYRKAMWLANVVALSRDLEALGGHLHVLDGSPAEQLSLAATSGRIDAIYLNTPLTSFGRRRDCLLYTSDAADE